MTEKNIPLLSSIYLSWKGHMGNPEVSKIRNVKMELALTWLKDCPACDHYISTNKVFDGKIGRSKNEKKAKKGLI